MKAKKKIRELMAADKVIIYRDAKDETDPEGMAELIKLVNRARHYDQWVVQFLIDTGWSEPIIRKIKSHGKNQQINHTKTHG